MPGCHWTGRLGDHSSDACFVPKSKGDSLNDVHVLQSVTSFQDPPSKLFAPAVVRQVLAHLMAQQWKTSSSTARLLVMAIGILVPALMLAVLARVLGPLAQKIS